MDKCVLQARLAASHETLTDGSLVGMETKNLDLSCKQNPAHVPTVVLPPQPQVPSCLLITK